MLSNYIGQHIFRLDTCHSTQEVLAQLLTKKKIQEGAVVLSDYQTDGRGMINTKWQSEAKKNILCSLVLYPTFLKLDTAFMLSKCISIAITLTLRQYTTTEIYIKWPNDIVILHKKIAGFVIANSIQNSAIEQCIIGIGININQLTFSADLQHAISLSQVTNSYIDTYQFEEKLFYYIEKLYDMLKENKVSEIEELYTERLYKNNGVGIFEYNNEIVESSLISVNTSGELSIIIKNNVITFRPKELKQRLG